MNLKKKVLVYLYLVKYASDMDWFIYRNGMVFLVLGLILSPLISYMYWILPIILCLIGMAIVFTLLLLLVHKEIIEILLSIFEKN